ncbi:MAG: hypothetical protein ACRD26_23535 [Vicinamibacterales bacterium]
MRKNPAAVALGRLGGRVVTEKKIQALRRNAAKGGRKPKFLLGARVRVNDLAPSDYRGRIGMIARRVGRAAYQVTFADGEHREGSLHSWWLDPVE